MNDTMTDEEILRKAIEKAVKNGYVTILPGFPYKNYPCFPNKENEHFSIIFEHEFAKAFWGEKTAAWRALEAPLAWQYHLQQMVLEEEPLKYLEKFL